MFVKTKKHLIFAVAKSDLLNAKMAQLVEHNLALKVNTELTLARECFIFEIMRK